MADTQKPGSECWQCGAVLVLVSLLKARLRVEHAYYQLTYNMQVFSQTWAVGGVLCSVGGNGELMNINKHKPWIETSYHGVITENMDMVLLDPPLVALDKDAPVPYADKEALIAVLTNRPQVVRIGDNTSSTLVLSTGTPQGNTIVKFADDTTIVGLILDNDETHYREEIQHLTQWCSNNNLVLNTSKTKEVIVDYRRSRRTEHAPLLMHRKAFEHVNNIKFLGIHITS
ncbi:hypothetical protein L3Q82_006202 [Scortum barcoo]|uniref:Uncharacterized protein n=1 Tax=Scortum barcoo TaxID=214431 RepID=A0ACB8X4A8_9TELE|nr:hypothetical protein L3Q82_006202 [Scortum barcoo]